MSRDKIENIGCLKNYKQGSILFEEGKPPKKVYYIINGHTGLFKPFYPRPSLLCTVDPNNLLGLKDLMLESPYDHTAFANEDSQILEIDGEAFINWLKTRPQERTLILQKLSETLVRQWPAFEWTLNCSEPFEALHAVFISNSM